MKKMLGWRMPKGSWAFWEQVKEKTIRHDHWVPTYERDKLIWRLFHTIIPSHERRKF